MLNYIMQAAPSGGGLVSFIPIIAIFAIFYFLIILPQNKRVKQHRNMLEELVRGDEVVTNGGVIGKVTKVDEDELTVQIAEGVKIKVVKSMVANVRNRTVPANDRKKS